MIPKCFEVLIIGCGMIAGGFDNASSARQPPLSHAGAFFEHDGFNIRACVEPDLIRREAFAKRWGVEAHAACINDLEPSPGMFDVISVCSPTDLHSIHILEALKLCPRIIFCEKPLTSTQESAAFVIEACRLQGVELIVNYTRRWDPTVADLEKCLKEGSWGKVRSVVGYYNKGILNNGSHMVELLLRLFGPMEVMAASHPEYDFWPEDPTVAAMLSTAHERIPIYLCPSNARDYSYFELEIVCELGVIRMLSGGMSWSHRQVVTSDRFDGYRTLNIATLSEGRYVDSLANAVKNIYEYLKLGTPIAATAKNALQVIEICMQIREQALENPPKLIGRNHV